MKKILFALFFVLYTTISFANEVLVIGCRPWDENLKDVKGLEKAHFLDEFARFVGEVPDDVKEGDFSRFPNFHQMKVHYDVTAALLSQSSEQHERFKQFCEENEAKFDAILIDYGTYPHLDLRYSLICLLKLLKPTGKLYLPLGNNIFRVQELIEILKWRNPYLKKFSVEVTQLQRDDLPAQDEMNLYRTDRIGGTTKESFFTVDWTYLAVERKEIVN